jgi:exopolyphosphatase/guanosine-5'-triphosphate,3'-diphosphate pyrophosphatase
VHLLVATVGDEGTSERRHAVHLLALGRRVAATRELGPELLHQTVELVSRLVEQARQDGAERVGVVGTEAVRNAADGPVLRDQIRERTREQLRILTGEVEARLSYLGGTSFHVAASAAATVVDVGGGSTEVVHGIGSRPQDGASLKLGSDQILQVIRADDPPTERQRVDAETRIGMVLEEAPAPTQPGVLIATGGTASNLPVLLGMWRPFANSVETLHGEGPHDPWTTLDRAAVERAVRLATLHSSAEVAQQTGLSPARSRLMAGGVLVLQGLLQHYHVEQLVVTERGLRDGVLLRLAASQANPPAA